MGAVPPLHIPDYKLRQANSAEGMLRKTAARLLPALRSNACACSGQMRSLKESTGIVGLPVDPQVAL